MIFVLDGIINKVQEVIGPTPIEEEKEEEENIFQPNLHHSMNYYYHCFNKSENLSQALAMLRQSNNQKQ